jgi:hypothetical protein
LHLLNAARKRVRIGVAPPVMVNVKVPLVPTPVFEPPGRTVHVLVAPW